ncbi:hypothetical protein PF66_06224 [Pseudomonas asplenii]|uniref:Uncharacterized protein n=1 Tax=Pseudomonas asplenii TaxID=53407 RepID=A0A0N0E164_9PSED|nr:hypothetical protein [Pseudomonas fuscovaginae]KPA87314.1 hypothetical protein PF66_06224 [Pseudomonas fuscovaginae]
MQFEIEKLSPEARRQVEALMRANGMTLSQGVNLITEASIAEGALSAVGRKKAQVLQLVTPMRASGRDS